eukprot:1047319-Prorocentrum_minimum.AAC.1
MCVVGYGRPKVLHHPIVPHWGAFNIPNPRRGPGGGGGDAKGGAGQMTALNKQPESSVSNPSLQAMQKNNSMYRTKSLPVGKSLGLNRMTSGGSVSRRGSLTSKLGISALKKEQVGTHASYMPSPLVRLVHPA